jgi:hypothetical protein
VPLFYRDQAWRTHLTSGYPECQILPRAIEDWDYRNRKRYPGRHEGGCRGNEGNATAVSSVASFVVTMEFQGVFLLREQGGRVPTFVWS